MVITGRPRAHSASSIKLNQVLQQLQGPFSAAAATASSSSTSSSPSRAGNRAALRVSDSTAGGSCGVVTSNGKKLSYSSPELRSMLVGLETTVPQNLNPSDLGSRHKPRPKRRGKMGSRASLHQIERDRVGGMSDLDGFGDGEGQCCGGCCIRTPCCCGCCRCFCCFCCCCAVGDGCCDCGDDRHRHRRGGDGGGGCACCHVHIFLVLMQLLVGAGVTAVSVYMFLYLSDVFLMRETPIWAGTPLCAAGILGIYFCATNFKDYSRSTGGFVLKVLCSVLSGISVFVCVTASIFAAIHLGRIFTYVSCQQTEPGSRDCYCFLPMQLDDQDDSLPRIFTYHNIGDCLQVFSEVKMFLLVVGSLCLAGSLFSLWFAILLWKARYGRFHSGVRLPSVKKRYSNPNP